jgi:hypothetical protein
MTTWIVSRNILVESLLLLVVMTAELFVESWVPLSRAPMRFPFDTFLLCILLL